MTGTDPFAQLRAHGMPLHAVFDLDALPPDVLDRLDLSQEERKRYRQLILIGNLGSGFWQALQQRGMHGSAPVDTFVGECVRAWMEGPMAGHAWLQVFPGTRPIGLQRLGELAGWHHPSPFWVGVDAEWGSWFAYRAVVLADTSLPVMPRRKTTSPCLSCSGKPCVSACPAGALASEQTGAWRLQACLDYRKQPGSACLDRCKARNACPVGESHRYSDEQIAYHYLHSMRAIREWY